MTTPVSPAIATGSSNKPEISEIDAELVQSMSRFLGFIGEKRRTVKSDEAQQMLDDIGSLRSAEGEESKSNVQRPNQSGSPEQNTSQSLGLVRGLITSAPEIAVNAPGKPLQV